MMPPPRRKKWTEAEERTLIDKYGEMVCEGTLAKMRTREKKYRPIALYVNSVHHIRDPIAYPWQWTWKDVSIKVQNMRHQYALVKQKIKKVDAGPDAEGLESFDWMEGMTHWSNFLRYREVFGDVSSVLSSTDLIEVGGECNDNKVSFEASDQGVEMMEFGHLGHPAADDFAPGLDGMENGVMSLEFDYEGEDGQDNNEEFHKNRTYVKDDEAADATASDSRKKRKSLKGLEAKTCGILAKQLVQLREMETRFEQREADRGTERMRRECRLMEIEQERERKWEERELEREEREKYKDKLRRERIQEWEAMEKESEERGRRRREEEFIYERESEERINRRRSEWKKSMDNVLAQHRTEMSQIHARLLHEQQNFTSQLIGIFSQWTGHPAGLSDHTGASSHYFSQMMQNVQHISGLVHDDERVDGDNQEDQFIVDG